MYDTKVFLFLFDLRRVAGACGGWSVPTIMLVREHSVGPGMASDAGGTLTKPSTFSLAKPLAVLSYSWGALRRQRVRCIEQPTNTQGVTHATGLYTRYYTHELLVY